MPILRTSVVLSLIAWCVGCDQGTKRLAVQNLKDHNPVHLLNGRVQFLYAENTGAWGSLGANWPAALKFGVFVLLPLCVLGALVIYTLRDQALRPVHWVAYSLIVGGGLGNIIDRIADGYVVDFMYVHVGRLGTNIFNVADVAVMAGLILLVLERIVHRAPSPPSPVSG